MKSYSDLLDIDTRLNLKLELEPIGTPDVSITIADYRQDYLLSNNKIIDYTVDLLQPFSVIIELRNKQYSLDCETAVIVRLSVDDIDIIPKYDYLADYVNDHDNHDPTSYLGFNGKWTLTVDRAFYHWLHLHSGQGWLFG
jgi:hypothetical protein